MSLPTLSPLARKKNDAALRAQFKACVVFNGKNHEPTVSELLGSKNKPWWGDSEEIQIHKRSPGWVWFHLPVVHSDWLRRLVWRLRHEKIIQMWDNDDHDDHGKRPDYTDYDDYYNHHDGWIETADDAQLHEVVSFIDQTFAGDKTVDFFKLDGADGSGEDPTFSVAMPFLSSEDCEAYKDSNNKISRLREIHEGVGEPEATTLLLSRTLGESFCVTTEESSSLNHDQVVRRYYDRCEKKRQAKLAALGGASQVKTGNEIKPRILMVSPLRLWKIGRDVVVTAFPSTFEKNRHFDFTPVGYVYQSVMKARPATAMHLVSEIMAGLVKFIDGSFYAGLHESLLAIFEAETSTQTQKQLELYQLFYHHLNLRVAPSLVPGSQPGGGIEPSAAVKIVNEEMECFRIVLDIRDELTMISSVISGQERAMKGVTEFTMNKVARTISQAMTWTTGDTNTARDAFEATYNEPDVIKEVDLGLAVWKLRISNIDKRAQMIEKALGHLLGLKLEVSNLIETNDSKEHLKSSRAIQKSSQDLLTINNQVLGNIKTLQEESKAIQESSKTLLASSKTLLTSIDDLQKSSKTLLESNNTLLMSIDNLQKSSRELQDKADKQSGYLFAFTMVTVIFAPLSFVASFFAIPSHDFPRDGDVSWSQAQIGGGLAISLAVTIVLAVMIIRSNEPKQEKNNA